MKVIILADSRGALLQLKIREELQKQYPDLAKGIEVTVRIMEGATLDNLMKKMDSKYPAIKQCDLLYIHTGVNNLTLKKGSTVQPTFDNIPELVDIMTDKFTVLKNKLSGTCKNIVISQLVGIDLHRYNREVDDGYWYYHQIVINEGMPILAHTINFINRADNLVGPWLTGTVHDFVNGKLYNRYGKLRDGLHPSEHTQSKWAKLFVKSIITNYDKMYAK